MKNYKKLPVVVQADQWWGFGDVPEAPIRFEDFDGQCYIQTLEGEYKLVPGHYIIKGVQGEFYPCDPDIFWKTYELTDDPTLSMGLGPK